jgi:hypothetical protein
MDLQPIIETVNKLFISVDNREWEKVMGIFYDKVLLDYTSMAGGTPAQLSSRQIIDSWKNVMPGFDKTHHQVGNYIVEESAQGCKVFCYGTATHYLVNESGSNIWTVVGSYNFELKTYDHQWRITMMKFNLKYTDGNNQLGVLAQERLKK